MRVLSARHIPSGEMRLAGALCVCVNAHFFYCCFPPISQSLLDHLFFFFQRFTRRRTCACSCISVDVWHACSCICVCVCVYISHLCSCTQVCIAHMYVSSCMDSWPCGVCRSGSTQEFSSCTERGDLRNQPCSNLCPGLLPSRTQPEGTNARPPPPPPPLQHRSNTWAPGPTQPW